MKISKILFFQYILAIYLVYSSICRYSIYFLGVYTSTVLVLFIGVLGLTISPKILKNNVQTNLFLLGWALVFLISIIVNGKRPGLILLNNFLFIWFYLSLQVKIQLGAFRIYVWFLSILVFLSAIEYIIYSITGYGIIIGTVTRSSAYRDTSFYHLIFNVIRQDVISVSRFQGLFIEPGTLGTVCAFMLFATWKIKALRIPFWVFFICGLLSLSLAYYVFLLVFFTANVKSTVKNTLRILILAMPLFFVFKNAFEIEIIERVDSADSVEELDNRTTEAFDEVFFNAFESGELWLGVGSNNIDESLTEDGGNAGAKKWIYQYGIISFIIIFFVYNLIYYRRTGMHLQYNDWVFLIVYWACFYVLEIFMTPSLFVIYSIIPILCRLGAGGRNATIDSL